MKNEVSALGRHEELQRRWEDPNRAEHFGAERRPKGLPGALGAIEGYRGYKGYRGFRYYRGYEGQRGPAESLGG